MESTAKGVLYVLGQWGHQVSHSHPALVVSDGACGFYRTPSPAHFRKPVHPLLASRPFRVLPSHRPPELGYRPSASLGVAFPSSRHRPAASLRRASHVPSPSVLGVSHALDGFCRHWPCGFVSPHSHVQGSPFRGFPSRTAEPPRRRLVPSRRCLDTTTGSCPPAP